MIGEEIESYFNYMMESRFIFSGVKLKTWLKGKCEEVRSFDSLNHIWQSEKPKTWDESKLLSWTKSRKGNFSMLGSSAVEFFRPNFDLLKGVMNILDFKGLTEEKIAGHYLFILCQGGVGISALTYSEDSMKKVLVLEYTTTDKKKAEQRQLEGCASTLAEYASEEMRKIFPAHSLYAHGVPTPDGNSFNFLYK